MEHCQSVSQTVLLNANCAIFQLYHDENKLTFNENIGEIRLMMKTDKNTTQHGKLTGWDNKR